MDAEVFNDNYELVNAPDVSVDIVDRSGKHFPFVFSKSDRAYDLNAGYLAPGNYGYAASTSLGDKKYTATGSFSVAEIRAEQSETVADHGMLGALAAAHSGQLYYPSTIDRLIGSLLEDESSKTVSFSQVKLQDLVDTKLVFFLLLLLFIFFF